MGKKPNMHTLCWTCRNAVGRCSWAKKGKPVDGWEATETKLVARKGKRTHITSYIVHKCPMYWAD